MADSINLSVRRAQKEGDSRLCSVEDNLTEAAKEAAEHGWTKTLTVYYRPLKDGKYMVGIRIAGCSTLEARGLMLSWIKEEILEDVPL